MSATGRSDVRIPHDAYGTPEWCVRALLKAWTPLSTQGRLLEPCVGQGSIIRAVEAVLPQGKGDRQWWAVDKYLKPYIDQAVGSAIATFQQADFLHWWPGSLEKMLTFDAAITNPPYSLAMEFLRHALVFSHEVTLLLRLGFLASQKRSEWLRLHVPDVYILSKRPSFTGGKTDATDYAWMVWQQGIRTEGRVRILEVE
jgi:hypothetical protein